MLMLMLMSAVEAGQMSAAERIHLSLLLINIYPPQRPSRRFANTNLGPPSDFLHRRSDSEHAGMLGAYVGPCWLTFGHVGSILAPTWPSWPNLGALLGHLGSNLAILARLWLSLGPS